MATQTVNETQTHETPAADETETALKAGATPKTPIDWRLTVIAGILTGIGWALIIIFGGATIGLLAGIAPVLGGIFVGRRIKGRSFMHGVLTSAWATLAGALILGILIVSMPLSTLTTSLPQVDQTETGAVSYSQIAMLLGMYMIISLVPFPIYGVMISYRTQERNRSYREEAERRGGNLQRPGRVTSLDDLQALPLPKFGSWIVQVFKGQGFVLEDYVFNKDVLDLKLQRADPEESWLVRCVTMDKVKPGMVQALAQELRDETGMQKGLVVTNYSVQDGAYKWVKSRRNIDVLDGSTLWEISQ